MWAPKEINFFSNFIKLNGTDINARKLYDTCENELYYAVS